MKEVYTANDEIEAQQVRAALEQQGIKAIILGASLAAAVPEIPFINALPSVHVADADAEQAQAIIKELRQPEVQTQPSKPWVCPKCGETMEGQFTECWHCGELAPR